MNGRWYILGGLLVVLSPSIRTRLVVSSRLRRLQWSLLPLSYEWSLIGGTVASNKLVLGTLKFTLNTQVALRRREGNVQGVQTQKTTYANHARKAFRSITPRSYASQAVTKWYLLSCPANRNGDEHLHREIITPRIHEHIEPLAASSQLAQDPGM